MITWTKDHPEATYSSFTGRDENGNVFHQSANLETVTVTTPDGRQGMGWTAEQALKSASEA